MQWCSRLKAQSPRYIAIHLTKNIPVIRHQTNIKPNEHSYLILQTLLLPNDFLLHSCRLELTCRLDLSPGITIGCCQWGSWLLTTVVEVLLPVWLLDLDCSWCVVAVRVTSLLSPSGSASQARADLMQERPCRPPPAAPPPHWPGSPLCTFPVATHCASPSQPSRRSGGVIRR